MMFSNSNRLPRFLFRSALMGFCLLASPVATTTTDPEPSDPCERRDWSWNGGVAATQCLGNGIFGTDWGRTESEPAPADPVETAPSSSVETPEPAPTVAAATRNEENPATSTPEREEPASDANQSLLGEPPGAFTRGVYRDEDGNARTVNGDVIKDMQGNPLPYSEGLKVVQDDAGNILSVEDEEKGVCYPAPGGNSGFGDLMSFMGDTPTDSGSETTPSRIQQAQEDAEAGRPLSLTNPTMAEIKAFNENVPIPYRPISEDCASDFMGPPGPGADCSRIAGNEEATPEESAPAPEENPVSTPEEEPSESDVLVQAPGTGGQVTREQADALREIPDEVETQDETEGDEIVVIGRRDGDEEAETPEEVEDDSSMDIPNTDPVSPDDFEGSSQQAVDDFLKEEGSITVTPPDSEVEKSDSEEDAPSFGTMNMEGEEPETPDNPEVEPESGNGLFLDEGISAVTDDELREQEDLLNSNASPEVDTNEEFNKNFFNGLMDEAAIESDEDASESEVVELPTEGNQPRVREEQNPEEEEAPPADFQPLPPLSSSELDEAIQVAGLEIEDEEATIQDSLLSRRVMVTSDGQQVVGIAVTENEGGEAPSQNSRQTYLDKGISEEKLDECDRMYGPGNYETCLKENLGNFVEGMMVESTGGLNIQPE